MESSKASATVRGGESTPVRVGLVGLGLMGSSIAACLVAAGHSVRGTDTSSVKMASIRKRVQSHLAEMDSEGLLREPQEQVLARLELSEDTSSFANCELVVESAVEEIRVKKAIIGQLEEVVPRSAILGTNTSAIPVTLLQEGARHPERILGIHWAEPAHLTRFMEIICGHQTELDHAEFVYRLAEKWGKCPTLVRKDIRGFIANRLMYAMFREAFYLVESGVATIEDVDRSLRYDMGWWISLTGAFRWMDLTGISAYATVIEDLFPELSNNQKVPELMEQLVASGAEGVTNQKGFYRYTPAQAERWKELLVKFTCDIRKLSDKYREEAENIDGILW